MQSPGGSAAEESFTNPHTSSCNYLSPPGCTHPHTVARCRRALHLFCVRIPETYQKHTRSIPEAYQMHTRCMPDAYQMHTRCMPDAYQMHTRCSSMLTPHAQELHLSGNRVGDATASALGDVLRSGGAPDLRDLRLNHNCIADEGAYTLAEVVSSK